MFMAVAADILIIILTITAFQKSRLFISLNMHVASAYIKCINVSSLTMTLKYLKGE